MNSYARKAQSSKQSDAHAEFLAETGPLAVKRELITQMSGFCTLCGHRYEAGSEMAALTTEPTPRGRIAHAACVAKHNAAAVL